MEGEWKNKAKDDKIAVCLFDNLVVQNNRVFWKINKLNQLFHNAG